MTLVDRLLKRVGLVKLSRFGLVLTAEGRIMSLRSAVLDDGLGGRIVGWHDADLAAMELEPMRFAPAPPRAVAPAVAISLPPVPAVQVPKAPVVTAVASPVVSLVAAPVVVASAAVAPAEEMDEDDWEWHIALARARAAAEEADQKAKQARFRDTIPTVRPVPALGTVPPPMPAAKPVIAVGKSPPARVIPLRADAPRPPSIARPTARPIARPITHPIARPIARPQPSGPIAARTQVPVLPRRSAQR